MIKSCRTLPPAERKALALLREAKASTVATPDAPDRVSPLGQIVRSSLLPCRAILDPTSGYVSGEEQVLLSMLALSQRRAQHQPPMTAQAIGHSLKDAAHHLLELGIKLSVTGAVAKIRIFWSKMATGPIYDSADIDLPDLPPIGSTLRSKVEMSLYKRGSLHRYEIERLGISRQYLSQLVRRGSIVRLETGRYALPIFKLKRPGLVGGANFREGETCMGKTTNKFAPDVREHVLRMAPASPGIVQIDK